MLSVANVIVTVDDTQQDSSYIETLETKNKHSISTIIVLFYLAAWRILSVEGHNY